MAISGGLTPDTRKNQKKTHRRQKMDNQKKLYIAYGSNLHLEQMAYRCPTAKVVGAAILNGRRLLFRGGHGGAVATVEAHKGGGVPVLVWEITPADEAALDRYEGFPFLYRKETVYIKLNGKRKRAMVYIMNTNGQHGGYRPLNQPGAGYYATILEGYMAAGFDTDILKQATEDSIEKDGMPEKKFNDGDYVVTSPDALIPNSVGKIVGLADDDYPGTKEHYIVDFEEDGTCTVHRDDMNHAKEW